MWLVDFLKKLIPIGSVGAGKEIPGSDGIQVGESYSEQTASELKEFFDKNPTGSIIENKRRSRSVKYKLRTEAQVIADKVADKNLYPNAVCEHGEDGCGKFAKVYYNGKAEIVEDEVIGLDK